jgi:hypothetical protein
LLPAFFCFARHSRKYLDWQIGQRWRFLLVLSRCPLIQRIRRNGGMTKQYTSCLSIVKSGIALSVS